MTPVALELRGRVAQNDGHHPPALREAVVDFDRDVALDARGLPACHLPGRDIRRSPAGFAKICRDAIVGESSAEFEYAYPERAPVRSSVTFTAYNRGVRDGVTRAIVVAFVKVPMPEPIVIPVEITKKPDFPLHALVRVPKLAGGAGSLIGFRLRIKRLFAYKGRRHSYLTARCPDDQFKFLVPKLLFRNELATPGTAPLTVMKGATAVPCESAG